MEVLDFTIWYLETDRSDLPISSVSVGGIFLVIYGNKFTKNGLLWKKRYTRSQKIQTRWNV